MQSFAGETPKAEINRRSFLKYVGAGATLFTGLTPLPSWLPQADAAVHPLDPWTHSDGTPLWQPPPYPVPLPGDPQPAATDAQRLARYEVVDDLVLPSGFRYEVLAQWGDRFGPPDQPDRQIVFGYNCDYTGLLPIPGSDHEFWLLVNHEYVSLRPWLAAQAEAGVKLPELRLRPAPDQPALTYGIFSVDGFAFPGNRIDLAHAELPAAVRATLRQLSDDGLAAQGVSILRVRRRPDGTLTVVHEATDHRRISAQGHANIALGPDGKPPFRFTGPTARWLAEAPRGTFCNCSGATTPWQTFLSCEENFHYQTAEDVTPAGTWVPERQMWFEGEPSLIDGVAQFRIPEPAMLNGMGYAASTPLDGRHYGWVVEVDPETGALQKHTALGRFRHENVALRCTPGRPLAAYMGDDRRGGHIWKFVSAEPVVDPADRKCSALLTQGTLYVARFHPDFTGEWIPLTPETPLRRPEPEHCPTEHLLVPARPVGGAVAIGNIERDHPALTVAAWQAIVEAFAGKPFAQCTLGDLVRPELANGRAAAREEQLGVILLDAFLMANAVGGTPTARPEDLEVHPRDASVYIAFTDATDSSEGSPDLRIFPDSKRDNSRQYGAVFRLVETGGDPAAVRFTWGKFISSGEVAEHGGGFANADNLVFDPQGNLWMVTDISTTALNFPTSRSRTDGTYPGGKQFPGVFGNNAMFMIPTSGPQAGVPHLFALGPMECEICGPTFAPGPTPDSYQLIASIQHPGEESGVRRAAHPTRVQQHLIHDRNNQPFTQERSVPQGSNFPASQLDRAPRPAVVCITRTRG